MQGESGPNWLSATDAALWLGVSQRTIWDAIARGELPASKRGRTYRIARADLDQYSAQRAPPDAAWPGWQKSWHDGTAAFLLEEDIAAIAQRAGVRPEAVRALVEAAK